MDLKNRLIEASEKTTQLNLRSVIELDVPATEYKLHLDCWNGNRKRHELEYTPLTASVQPSDESSVVRHLLLSFPELEVAHDGRDIIDALVEGAIAQLLNQHGASKMLVLTDISQAIRDCAGLAYEPSELISAFERLESRGCLSFRDTSHRSFVFDEARYRVIVESFGQRAASWDTVRAEWVDGVRHRHGLEEGQASALWDALDGFTTELINANTAEAAAFLYVSDATGQGRFYEALSLRLPDVSEIVPEPLLGIAHVEFPKFFDPANKSRTDFLTARLRASFFFHLLSLDPLASHLVRDHVSEKTLYLDSNFLFRLIGFDGPAMAFAPNTAVEISKQLNCKLVVGQETIDEYVRVVRASTARLNGTPIQRDAYLRIASEHPSDEGNFMAAFYRELQSGRVRTVDEFARRWTNIHALLDQWEIEVDREAVLSEEEQGDDEFLDQVSALTRWQGEKHADAVTHDVFMLRYIARKRGRGEPTPARTKVLLLTFDRQLTRFAAHRATESELPTTVLCEDWLQIARPFLPRTEDYAKSFVSMLKNPLLFHLGKIPFAHIAGALSRLERYSELPESLVGAMMADEQFVRAFTTAEGDEQARHLLELKVGELAGATVQQNEELREMLERALAQSATLQQQIDTLSDARDKSVKEREVLTATLASTRLSAEQRLAEVERLANAKLEATVSDLQARHDSSLAKAITNASSSAADEVERRLTPVIEERIRSSTRWTIFWTGGIGATLAAAVFLFAKWNALTAGRIALVFVAAAAVWALLLAAPKGWGAMLTVISALITVAAFAIGAPALWKNFAPAAPSNAPSADAPTQGTPRLSHAPR